jgi:hypothetical protein
MKVSKHFSRFVATVLRRFSPGYNPRADVFGGVALNGRPWNGGAVNALECLYLYESRGIDALAQCSDAAGFRELYERKCGMDLTIGMWKEDLNTFGALHRRAFVMELAREFPISFLYRTGIVALGGFRDIKQVGMSLGWMARGRR